MKRRRSGWRLLLALLPTAALANVIFPALILTERLFSWWIIAATILIEAGFVMLAFRLTPCERAVRLARGQRSVGNGWRVDAALCGLHHRSGHQQCRAHHRDGLGVQPARTGRSPSCWRSLMNLAIELAVYRFGYRLKVGARELGLIAAANAITVLLALLSIAFIPSSLY